MKSSGTSLSLSLSIPVSLSLVRCPHPETLHILNMINPILYLSLCLARSAYMHLLFLFSHDRLIVKSLPPALFIRWFLNRTKFSRKKSAERLTSCFSFFWYRISFSLMILRFNRSVFSIGSKLPITEVGYTAGTVCRCSLGN